MRKIKFKAEGFINKSPYLVNFPSFFEKYESKFGDAESIFVSLKEIPAPLIHKIVADPIIISDDGKSVNINFTDFQIYDKKDKLKNKPSVQDVFASLGILMDRAVEEYSNKFNK